MRFSKLFNIYSKDNDEEKYVSIENVYSVLSKEGETLIKHNLRRSLNNFQGGPRNVHGKDSVSLFSVLKYLFINSSHKSCSTIINYIINELTEKIAYEPHTITSSLELYKLIAKSRINDNDLFKRVQYDEDNIPTLIQEHKHYFTELEWKHICWFENDFSRECIDIEQESEYEAVLKSKYEKYQSMLKITECSKKWLDVSREQIRQKTVRYNAAEKESQVQILAGLVHIAPVIDDYIFKLLNRILPDIVRHAVCFNTTLHNQNDNCLWVALSLKDVPTIDTNYLCTRIFFGCKREHNVYIEQIFVIDQAGVKDFVSDNGYVYRFLLRDAIETGALQDCTTVWQAGCLIDGTIDNQEEGGKCEPCFSNILCKPLSKESLDIANEWYIELPIITQIMLEKFVSKKSMKRNSNFESFTKKKLEKLFMLYDNLLHILNKQFIGVFQKANSQKLLIEYKSIGSVFDITSSAGATVSLAKAESQLKSSACKDMCYYNTYLKEHKLLYSSVTGDVKEFVSLRGCHLILMLDNLVRLKYVADPNPGEHRSKQICTLPITLQGLPLDSSITEAWHLPECDGSQNCICKSPLQLKPDDVEHTLLRLTEIQEQTHQQFFDLMAFGYPQLWKDLPDELLEYLGDTSDPKLIEETVEVLNTDYPAIQEDDAFSDDSDKDELDESLEEALGTVGIDEIPEFDQYTLPDSDQDMEEEQVQFLELETSLQNMSITDKDDQKQPCMREILQSFGFKKNLVEPLLTRHPEPAVGRDDDLNKIQEILDDVLVKMGYVSDPKKCRNRILCGPDNKIGKLLLQLMAKDKKYQAFLPEFPVLHLRKSKINILFGSYKHAGLIEILKYLKDEEQDDWAKLISISHIDMATKFVKRISLAMHLAFLITFIKQLDQNDMHEIVSDLERGVGIQVSQKWSYRFGKYLSEGVLKSPTFELHVDMMRHCDEVVAIALAERLGGHKGYALLLSAVKSSLLFSFLNNATSYAPFCTKLLYQHYSAGFFHQCLKHELFSTHFKGSLKNFGLDTKREMDHLEALKGFRAGSTVTSATCRMSLIDSLNETEVKQTSHLQSNDEDMLGWILTEKDLAYIYKGTALILRQNALTLESDLLYNVYSKIPLVLPNSILDSCSRDAGKYLLMKFLHKEQLFCLEKDNFVCDDMFQGPVELVNRAKRSKGTTIRRLVPSQIRSLQTELQSKEEIRKRKVMKESKTIDHFSSLNNTCQAILRADSSKPKVLKAIGMKKALLNTIQLCTGSQEMNKYIHLNTKGISESILASMKICLVEFAGVKFKTSNIQNGTDYLEMVTKMIDGIVNKSQKISQVVICEEKYSFTPDTFKAETRKQRETKSSDVGHLKTPDSVISEINFDKDLATKTAMGKKCISTYLARNLEKIVLQKSINIIVDSEAVPGKVCDCTHNCDCIDHCIPVACTRQPNSNTGQIHHMTEIRQRKGEAEMAIVDWLISLQHTLGDGEAVVSLVTSGDIDAVYIHLFALCRLRVQAGVSQYKNPVYVVLQKPGGINDVYNITSILTLLEEHYCDEMIGCKLAITLAIGGNDFIPKFYSHSHDEFCKAVLGIREFRNGLFNFENEKCYLNMDMYVELLKFIYTPKRYQHSNLSFEDVRSLSIGKTEDANTKSGFRTADPRKWLPPKSCVERLSSLVQLQIDYLLTAGIHAAEPLDFLCACLRRNVDGESEYDFGPDAYFSNLADLPNTKQIPRKRQLQDTPQRGQRRKKQLTSTPRKM